MAYLRQLLIDSKAHAAFFRFSFHSMFSAGLFGAARSRIYAGPQSLGGLAEGLRVGAESTLHHTFRSLRPRNEVPAHQLGGALRYRLQNCVRQASLALAIGDQVYD